MTLVIVIALAQAGTTNSEIPERVYKPFRFDVKKMVWLTFLAMLFGAVGLTAGILLIVFRSDLGDGTYGFITTSASNSDNWTAPIIAATSMISAAFLGGVITSCLLLGLNWSERLQRERSYLVAFPVVIIFAGLLVVSMIMGAILLIRLSRHQKVNFTPQKPSSFSLAGKAQG